MTSIVQARGHIGQHHHHHHHNHDNTYLTSTNKKDAGVRITRIGLYVNLGMAIGKGIGGYVFNSQSLSADAIHSLTDLVSDFMTLATVSWSLKLPTERFPSGYGKVESLGSLGVSGLLLGGGFMMGWAALLAITQQFFPDFAECMHHLGFLGHSHGHDHSHTDLGPNINAAWLAAGSIVIKEWLYRATLKIAQERKSSVLASNAYHHRVDSLTAIVALIMIAGSNVVSNATWLDPLGGLIISGMVIQAGWANTKDALLELADVGLDDEMKISVQKAAHSALADFLKPSPTDSIELRQVQGVKAGQNYLVHLELAVPRDWTIEQTRKVEGLVRQRLGAKVRGVRRVRVRFVTLDSTPSNFLDEFIHRDCSPGLNVDLELYDDDRSHSRQTEPSQSGSITKRK